MLPKVTQRFHFLGLTIHESLTWNSHTTNIALKISKTIGVLNRLKHFLPIHVKLIIYNSLILSHLQYCILLWGYQLGRTEKLQKKAIRVISSSKYNAHTDPLFKSLKILKLKDILLINELKFYYKYINNTLPANLQKLPWKPNSNLHNHNTRIKSNIHTVRVKHEFAKKCIKFNIPLTINSTPGVILDKIHTHSLPGFTQYIKQYLLNQYTIHCQLANCYVCNHS